MLFKVKSLGLYAGRPVAIVHARSARKMRAHTDQRVLIKQRQKELICVLDTSTGMLTENEVVLSQEVIHALALSPDSETEKVEIILVNDHESTKYIQDKLNGKELDAKKIHAIIADIVSNKLANSEIAYFVAAVYINGMTDKEIEHLIRAIVDTGKKLDFGKQIIADKHSIGGIAGNRTTPIVVSICAAAGIRMPKTSSRAITSAAGTADTMETIANVEFSAEEIKSIVEKVNACMVWGGALGLAPADDKIIQVEKTMNIDPEAQLLASILSKKIAVGSTHVLIDIPCGKSAKFMKKEGEKLRLKFMSLGKKFGLKMRVVLTDGSEPIGNGIGPVLEMRDILAVLKQEPRRPLDLEKKSVMLAGEILELTNYVKPGEGKKKAVKILSSLEAYQKFRQIILAQQGNADDSDEKLELAQFSILIKAHAAGKITEIDNKKINAIAHAAGCPADKSAGLYLHHHVGETVQKGEVIATLYAETESKMDYARKMYERIFPITIAAS